MKQISEDADEYHPKKPISSEEYFESKEELEKAYGASNNDIIIAN